MFILFRRVTLRHLSLSAIFLCVLMGIYYVNYGSPRTKEHFVTARLDNLQRAAARERDDDYSDQSAVGAGDPNNPHLAKNKHRSKPLSRYHQQEEGWEEKDTIVSRDTCPVIGTAKTDVDTVEQFRQFEFQPYWMKSKEYWDADLEERFKNRKAKWAQLPLKVIVVPHSHNDPGWLKTYESYFHYQTRHILNNMVDKMQQYRNMTFIWTEISFFALWWESAHPTKRRVVRKLLEEGRLEITTGGWVMTDEATAHVYAMVDQLIEGHQWVKNNLGVMPKTGWSIDPFGHGATVPYLLRASGLNATVIQRVHYAWKQWLAQKQMGDFIWRQAWASEQAAHQTDMLTHNQPFDIYSIKHSCGPHPQVCLNFDFRKVAGEYTDYSVKAVPIDERNVKDKADLLLEQYGRTASLFPHNVVLMPLGDDFRFDHAIEWDQQYTNYQRLFEYINANPTRYQNTQVTFGTPSDYFNAVQERMTLAAEAGNNLGGGGGFRSLRGDFFVYSDIFSEGRPAYWSGYFTTRPYWKQLDRDLETSLRSAEILYTVALGRARQHGANRTVQLLERDFEKLVKARRNLGLFQHHDAITGTSKAIVMQDYAFKLFEGLQDSIAIQSRSAHALLLPASGGFDGASNEGPHQENLPPYSHKLGGALLTDTDRESYEQLPRKVPVVVPRNEPRRVVMFNPLAQHRQEVARVRLTSPNVRVLNATSGAVIPCQINPVWNNTFLVRDQYEVIWVADLPPLTLVTYILERVPNRSNIPSRAVVYCSKCTKSATASATPSNIDPPPFEIRNIPEGYILLENHKWKLLFDDPTGFLKAITRKATGHTTQCALQFAAYPSAQYHSGAYLFMPDPNSREPEKEVFQENSQEIVITSGQIASEIIVSYGKLLSLTLRIFHADGALSEGVYMESAVDFDAAPKNRETELFMRFVTDISNGQGVDGSVPEFYTDQNGFQMQRRVKVERIGIEGNYFPVTTMTYLQDGGRRLSVLVSHALGAASWKPGWLELMLDRRTLYDDSRGMGEGVVDNKRTVTRFWLLLEELSNEVTQDSYSRPSLFAHHLSNSLLYPATLFVIEGSDPPLSSSVSLLSRPLPCDTHLLTLRTLTDPVYPQFPATSALMVLHKQGFSCRAGAGVARIPQCALGPHDGEALHPGTRFTELVLGSVGVTSLTGMHSLQRLHSLDDVRLPPMQLLTLNLTFVL